ncbi:MAG: UDP-3-O-[3-hydroxymyristoyl] glucosamine N-acyltransferase, partial [Myxococcota bacterium]
MTPDPTATLGSNVVIARDVTVSAGAVIGDDGVLLRRAYVGVDAVVGDGAIIGGRLEDAAAPGPAQVLA